MAAADLPVPAARARTLGRYGIALLSLLTIFWGIVMLQFGEREIYTMVGLYALFVCAAVLLMERTQALAWFHARKRDLATGLIVGALMTALTYPLYRFAVALVPALEPIVAGLYRTSHKGNMGVALLWVLVIITAEELLFRGAWLSALERYVGKRTAVALSIALYAGAQAFSGSLVVGLLALCCGTLWTFERVLTGSIVAPLLSHMIWTPIVILLHPVLP